MSVKIYTQSIKYSTQKLVCSQYQMHTYSAYIRDRERERVCVRVCVRACVRVCVRVCVYDASTVYLCHLLVYSLRCVVLGEWGVGVAGSVSAVHLHSVK